MAYECKGRAIRKSRGRSPQLESKAPSCTRVCFVLTAAYPLFNPECSAPHGGAEVQVSLLSKELAKDPAFEVWCIVGDYGQPEIEFRHGVTLLRSFNPRPNQRIFAKLSQTRAYLRLFKRVEPDVVVTTTSGPVALIAAIYRRLSRSRHLHRTAHERDLNLSLLRENGLRRIAYISGIRMADVVVTQSEEHRRELAKFRVSATVLRNVFPLDTYLQPPFEEREGVLWVGRYVEFKQPWKVLELSDALPNIPFSIICTGDSSADPDYQRFCDDAKKRPNVSFREHVRFSTINTYFETAIAFLSTSTAEGFPNTFLQALAAGTPIVSLNVDPDGMFERYDCGIACNGHFSSMIDAITRLYSDQRYWEARKRDSVRYVREIHSPERNIEVLKKELFRTLCSF